MGDRYVEGCYFGLLKSKGVADLLQNIEVTLQDLETIFDLNLIKSLIIDFLKS